MASKRFRKFFLGLMTAMLLMALTAGAAFAQEQEGEQEIEQENNAYVEQNGAAIGGSSVNVGVANDSSTNVFQNAEVEQKNKAKQKMEQFQFNFDD